MQTDDYSWYMLVALYMLIHPFHQSKFLVHARDQVVASFCLVRCLCCSSGNLNLILGGK